VRDAQGLQIWLISSETLKLIPALADAGGRTGVETLVPAWTLEHGFLSLSLGHWIVLVILLLGTFTLLALFGAACNLLARKIVADPVRRGAWDAWYRATRWPAIVALTIIIQFTVIPSLGFPLSFRVIYSRIGLIAFVIVMTWLLRSGLSLTFSHARGMVRGKDRASTQSLMLLTERMLNAAIVVIAIIAVLILLGVESKTALAALGVVGVALALGAQKTVENLLGGIFLLSDRALAVGDYCTIANQSGVVEDVTLRSVRLRTTNQSLVSLPAGSLAQTGIENFASRTKMPVISTLRLRYGTSAAQLKRILAEVRTLLETNPMFETGTSFIGLVNFGPEAIELELFAFVLTNDGDRFRIVREELLLEIAARVDAAGSGLAPTRFVQMQPGADGTVLSQAAAGSAAATREH
jgi:MscS family membrane protein